jgi:hypothetical protein
MIEKKVLSQESPIEDLKRRRFEINKDELKI